RPQRPPRGVSGNHVFGWHAAQSRRAGGWTQWAVDGFPHRPLMIRFMIMRIIRISRGGQVSVPAQIRHRWGTSRVALEDLGDRIVLRPAADDPIASARGALAGELSWTSEQMRARARKDEAGSERRGPRA